MRTALLLLLAAPAWATPVTTITDGLADMPPVDDDAVEIEAPEDASAQVWNGSVVPTNQLRAVVSLFTGRQFGNGSWGGGSFCSGTLVHPEWVVTAAHCLDGAENQTGGGFELHVGIGNEFPFERQILWEGYVIHPDYNPNAGAGAGYDIGLVKLATPVYDEPLIGVNGVEMDQSWIGLELTLAGFGITNDNRNDGGVKRRTTLPLINYDGDLLMSFNGSVFYSSRDEQYYPSRYNSTSNVCSGDSGGATLAPTNDGGFVLVGVNAIVTPGCQNGAAGSTRTDWYVDWIDDYVPLDEVQVPGGNGPIGPEFQLESFEAGELEALPYGDPLNPTDALAYERVVACDHSGGGRGWLMLGAFGLFGWRRQRSSR